jgi:predicted N-acetyltransferase YhbS
MQPRLIEARGDATQRGRQIGQATAAGMAAIRESRERAFARHGQMSFSQWLDRGRQYIDPLREFAPRTFAEMQGMADGAGLSFSDVLLLTCIYEKGMGDGVAAEHCTSFAARGAATRDGALLCGQTDDEDPLNWAQGTADYVAHHHDEDGLQALIFTHAGIPAYIGMNSAGLCVLWNSIDNRERAIGVPSCALIREVLFCTELDQAEEYLRSAPHSVPNNFLLAHARDGMLNMEITPTGIGVQRHHESLCHANHIVDNELAANDSIIGIPNETTCFRMARMAQLLQVNRGHIDVPRALAMVSDHDAEPRSICSHVRPGWPFATMAAIVFEPAQGAMHIAFGNGCSTAFMRYEFSAETAAPATEPVPAPAPAPVPVPAAASAVAAASAAPYCIERLSSAEIDAELDRQLRDLLCLAYGQPAAAVFALQRYYHEPPQWHWIMRDGAGRPMAHAAVHEKTIGTPQGDIEVAGIGEVCVHPHHRGHGHVRHLLAAMHAHLEKGPAHFAILMGNPQIYTSSGYVLVKNKFLYRDGERGNWREEYFNHAMVRPLGERPWPQGRIDLRGPSF